MSMMPPGGLRHTGWRLIQSSAYKRYSRKLREPFYPFTLGTLIKLEAGPIDPAFS